MLSNRARFRFFYRMGTPDQKYIMARIGLMQKYNWRKISTIHQAIEFFSVVRITLFQHQAIELFSVVRTITLFINIRLSSYSVLYVQLRSLSTSGYRVLQCGTYNSFSTSGYRVIQCCTYNNALYQHQAIEFFSVVRTITLFINIRSSSSSVWYVQ